MKTSQSNSRTRCALALGVVMMFVSSAESSQTIEWTVYNTSNSGLPYNGATALAIDSQGSVWVGTGKWYALEGGGLAKFDGENWAVYNTTNSRLPHYDCSGVAIDPDGNIWCGTEGGLAKFDGTNWTVYTTANSGLPANLVATPVFDADGNLWAGTWEGGLVRFDGQDWTVFNTANSGLPHNIPFATVFDAQGNLWIGTVGGGLARFDGVDWTVYDTNNSHLPNNTIWYLAFDSDWNLWIATDGGLAKFDGTNWTVYNKNNSGLPSNVIWPIAIDARERIWVGTADSGLAMFDGIHWTVYNTSNSGLPDNRLNYLAVDAEGGIWIAAQGGGLAVLRARPNVDFNGDGWVDIRDLLRLIASWGQDDPATDIAPPFGDGIVDAADLEALMALWNQEFQDPALIAHWTLDETEGIDAIDSAGSHHGIVVGAPAWQPDAGQMGGALEFDGATCVTTDSILNPNAGPFSVLAWVKGGGPGQVIVSQAGGADWVLVDPDTGALMTDLKELTTRRPTALYSSALIADGDWHRVGLVWDGVNRSLHVDGVEVAADTQGDLPDSDGGLYLGCGKEATPGTFFVGLIDDVRIYNRAVQP